MPDFPFDYPYFTVSTEPDPRKPQVPLLHRLEDGTSGCLLFTNQDHCTRIAKSNGFDRVDNSE